MPEVTQAEVDVVVKVDAKLKKDWSEASKELQETQGKGAMAWHRKYEVVSAIVNHKPPLYLAGGISIDNEFYEKILEETRQEATRGMRVVKLATVEDVKTYKVGKLNLAITYVEGKGKKALGGRDDIDFAKLRIPVAQSGKVVSKSLRDISYFELREAIRELAIRPRAKPASPEMKLVLAALKRSGVKGVKATYTNGALNLRLPMSGVAAIARELTDFDPSKS